MGRNLTNLPISASFQYLTQISGSELTDGLGNDIDFVNISASHALVADTALNVPATASYALYADQAGTSGFSVTASYAENFNPAATASYALYAEQAGTSGYAVNALSASIANTSGYAVLALTSSHALYAEQAGTSGYAVTASYALDSTPNTLQEVLNAGDTATGDINLTGDINATNITASGIEATTINTGTISGSQAFFTSASITNLTTVTGSIVQIGDAFVLLNTDTPTSRYAGILVEDSGSLPTNYTASFFFDSVTNDWNYEYFDGAQTDFGVAIFGPEYNTKGAPVYLTANTLPKAVGSHHLEDSSISDDGTLVTIDANISGSGYVSASAFIGDGSQLTNLPAGASTLQEVLDGGNDAEQNMFLTGSVALGDNRSNTFDTATTSYSAQIASYSSSISNGNNKVQIAAKQSNNTSTNENNVQIGTREANMSATGVGNGQYSAEYSTLGGSSSACVILGGYGNSMNNAGYSSIMGGESNTVNVGYSHVLGSVGSQVTGGSKNTIVGGESHTISGGSNNTILGGLSHTATHNRSAVIGGDTLSTTKDDEVVVPNLSIYGDTAIDNGVTSGQLIDNIGQTVVSVEDAVKHIVHCTQAEYDAITPDINTLYVIDGAETLGDTNVDGYLTGTVNTLTDAAGTTTLDCSVGNYFTLAMPAGGTTELTPLNIQAGQTINIKITQNATASTLTFASSIDFPGGTAFTISTGAGAVDVLTLVSFDGTTLQATGLANFS